MSAAPRRAKASKSSRKKPRRRRDAGGDEDELRRQRRAEAEAERERQRRIAEAQRQREEEEQRRRAAAALRQKQSAGDDDDDDDYGSDEFEDYSDDFDDFEEPPKPAGRSAARSPANQEVLDALRRENEQAKKYKATAARTPEKKKPSTFGGGARNAPKPSLGFSQVAKGSPSKSFGGPGVKLTLSPKAGLRGSGRAKRVKDLKKLVTLSEDAFEVFFQPPLAAIDVYMRSVRSGAVRQVQAQTNGDAVTVPTQTEKIETKAAGMQFPDDIGFGGSSSGKTDREARSAQSMRLSKFLRSATQVCEALLEENLAGDVTIDGSRPAASASKLPEQAAQSSIEFTPDTPLTSQRELTSACLSVARPNELLCSYTPVARASRRGKRGTGAGAGAGAGGSESAPTDAPSPAATAALFEDMGLLCVWDIHHHSSQRLTLLCPGTPQCCAFSPDRSHVAVAGTAEGSVVMWDFREPNNMHRTKESNVLGLDSGLRKPSYSTDNMAMVAGVNGAGIVQVKAFTAAGAGATPGASGKGSDEKMSFQIASLDDRGTLVFWVVVELSANDLGVSEVDLGLGIGARIKLVKSASVDVSPGPLNKAVSFDTALVGEFGPCVSNFALCPDDVGRCLVASVRGDVLHKSRFGEAPPPRTFRAPGSARSAATSIAVAPWSHAFFLVGYADGVLCLFGMDSQAPVAVWDDATGPSSRGKGPAAIIHVEWSGNRPGVFFVLDSSSRLHVWDLLSNDSAPVFSQQCLPQDCQPACLSVTSSERVKTQNPAVAVASTRGTVSVQILAEEYAVPLEDEIELVQRRLSSIM